MVPVRLFGQSEPWFRVSFCTANTNLPVVFWYQQQGFPFPVHSSVCLALLSTPKLMSVFHPAHANKLVSPLTVATEYHQAHRSLLYDNEQ